MIQSADEPRYIKCRTVHHKDKTEALFERKAEQKHQFDMFTQVRHALHFFVYSDVDQRRPRVQVSPAHDRRGLDEEGPPCTRGAVPGSTHPKKLRATQLGEKAPVFTLWLNKLHRWGAFGMKLPRRMYKAFCGCWCEHGADALCVAESGDRA